MDQCCVHCTWVFAGFEMPLPMGVEGGKVTWIWRYHWVQILTLVGPKGIRACQVQVVECMVVILNCLGTVHEMQDEADKIMQGHVFDDSRWGRWESRQDFRLTDCLEG